MTFLGCNFGIDLKFVFSCAERGLHGRARAVSESLLDYAVFAGRTFWSPFLDTYLATRCLFDGQGYLLLASVGVRFGHSRADCAFPCMNTPEYIPDNSPAG